MMEKQLKTHRHGEVTEKTEQCHSNQISRQWSVSCYWNSCGGQTALVARWKWEFTGNSEEHRKIVCPADLLDLIMSRKRVADLRQGYRIRVDFMDQVFPYHHCHNGCYFAYWGNGCGTVGTIVSCIGRASQNHTRTTSGTILHCEADTMG